MAKTAKTIAIRTGKASPPLLFRHVSPGPDDSTLKFRLLHFWEARKNGTQGFIGQNRRNQYEKELQRGSIYTLTNFYASNSKVMYYVADQRLVICISHASALSKDEEDIEGILTERFRVCTFSEFEANCDLRGELHDVVGHLKLVDGQALHQRPVLCTNDDSASRKVMVHLQLKDSMFSSRVFLDEEVDPTNEYLAWLTTNPSVTSLVNPVEVVKAETLTIGEIAAFLKRQPAQENGGDAAELEVPLPQCFIDTIGQTKKFRIKVAHYNFTSTRLSLTVTKIVSPAELPPKNPPLKTPPGTEVENTELAESSGGASAIDDQKKAKRTKRSG
ncbi:hypothetical protein Bca4012_070221 [Brassica carinata]